MDEDQFVYRIMNHDLTSDDLHLMIDAKERMLEMFPALSLDGYVYLIEFNGLYKIGKAKDISKRMRSFANVILPYEFNLIYCVACRYALATEKAVHRSFRDRRIKGEWFAFDELGVLDVQAAMLMFAKTEGAISRYA